MCSWLPRSSFVLSVRTLPRKGLARLSHGLNRPGNEIDEGDEPSDRPRLVTSSHKRRIPGLGGTVVGGHEAERNDHVIGANLRRAREARGMTQAEVAK